MKQGWEIRKLGEVATYVNGYAFKPEHWGETGVPIIRIQNLNNLNADFNYCESDIPQKFVIEDGDILISWSASLGVYEWNRGKAYLNQHIFKVVFDKINISKYFLKYAVSAKLNEMLKDAHGATMKHIVKSDFDNTTIPYPPLPEQEKIVAELDCLSGIIEKKKQQLKELDSLAESIFYTMFGDPITNEKGWEVKKVIEVVKMQRGFDLPVQDRDGDGMIPIYGSNGVIGHHSTHKAEYGIITGRSGTLGEVYSSNKPFWPLNTTLFSVDTHGNNLVFLKFLISNFHLERFKAGAGVPTLNRNEFHGEDIPNIPLPLQQEFASKIEAIEKQKELIKESIKEAEELFNSRMDYYFG